MNTEKRWPKSSKLVRWKNVRNIRSSASLSRSHGSCRWLACSLAPLWIWNGQDFKKNDYRCASNQNCFPPFPFSEIRRMFGFDAERPEERVWWSYSGRSWASRNEEEEKMSTPLSSGHAPMRTHPPFARVRRKFGDGITANEIESFWEAALAINRVLEQPFFFVECWQQKEKGVIGMF